MSRSFLLLLPTLLPFACAQKLDDSGPSDADADADSDADTDTDSDTDTDTDSDSDSDTDTDSDSDSDLILDHGILVITVAGRNEGFDLDGDGAVDNAMWALGTVFDPVFSSLLAGSTYLPVIQLADIAREETDTAGDALDDSSVQLALVTGQDTDGDPSDNGSGSEGFTAGVSVDAAGRAVAGTDVALVSSAYEATLLDSGITVGTLTLQSTTPVYISGTVAEGWTTQTGLLGLGVATDSLTTALTAAGYGDTAALVEALADLDTDADGAPDAVSMAFAFDATRCTLTP